MKYLFIILILFVCVFLEYVPDWHEEGITMTFPFNSLTISSEWYWYVVYKDLQIVVLAWALWFWAIPKELKFIKAFTAVFCTFVTAAPVYFVLFYSVPFPEQVLAIKLGASALIGFIIFIFNDGGIWNRYDTGSDYN